MGRRRYNAGRQLDAKIRRLDVLTLIYELGGFRRGVQAEIASILGVSEATISRDIKAILPLVAPCTRCGSTLDRHRADLLNAEDEQRATGRRPHLFKGQRLTFEDVDDQRGIPLGSRQPDGPDHDALRSALAFVRHRLAVEVHPADTWIVARTASTQEPVGVAAFTVVDGAVIFLLTVAVVDDWRGHGVGKELVAQVATAAAFRGAERLVAAADVAISPFLVESGLTPTDERDAEGKSLWVRQL